MLLWNHMYAKKSSSYWPIFEAYDKLINIHWYSVGDKSKQERIYIQFRYIYKYFQTISIFSLDRISI